MIRGSDRTTWRSITALLVVGMLAATSVGCGSSSGPAGPPLRIDMVDGGFEISLTDTSKKIGEGYDVVAARQDRRGDSWVDTGDWQPAKVTDDPKKVVFTDVESGHLYRFRFRRHRADHDPEAWSEAFDRLYVTTTLPVIRIDTDDGQAIADQKRPGRDATVEVRSTTGDDSGSFTAPAKVRGRGNTTWANVPGKKSYQINFDEKQGPLGMPTAKKWVLLANFFDRSQLRTWTGMEVSRAAGLAWTPQLDWVEVVFNGDYAGVYQLVEKIDVAKDKVDIAKLDDLVIAGDDLTGGYLLEIGETNGENLDRKQVFTTDRGVPLSIYRPDLDDSNPDQFVYIMDQVQDFEAALFSAGWTDPTTGYAAHLDVDAFIDYWIVEELMVNIDAFISSTYLSKQRNDPKLTFGPVWDLDVSMGSQYGYLASTPEGWHTISPDIIANDKHRPWVMRLFQDPAFVKRVDARWHELVDTFRQLPDRIDRADAGIATAKANDLLRWADDVETRFGHRYGDTMPEDDVGFLHDWLATRIDWMTGSLDRLAAGGPAEPAIPTRPGGGPS